MKKQNKRQKVFVGLSGGVDSSVAAALLKEQGYEVTGVFIKIWDEKWGECQWKQDRRDAMQVAMKLGIPLKTLDLSEEYKKDVLDYMIKEYKAGRTPNPDVVCNSRIKFGDFLKWSLKNGADFIATGHYVRLRETQNPKPKTQNNIKIQNLKSKTNIQYPISNIQLLQGVDRGKDQSYFLWQLKQGQLKHCLFPVGEYKKSEVRKMARKFGLPTAEKKDSQGICFVGKVGMKDFLKNYIKPKRGSVLNAKGEVIGHHDGAMFFTIGQRHGFVITKKGTDDRPYYVVGKDVGRNTVTVSTKQENKKTRKQNEEIIIYKVNWIADKPRLRQGYGGQASANKKYKARYRHLQPLLHCYIAKLLRGEYKIVFSKAQERVAPGQSLVLYDGEVCLGGGVIK